MSFLFILKPSCFSAKSTTAPFASSLFLSFIPKIRRFHFRPYGSSLFRLHSFSSIFFVALLR